MLSPMVGGRQAFGVLSDHVVLSEAFLLCDGKRVTSLTYSHPVQSALCFCYVTVFLVLSPLVVNGRGRCERVKCGLLWPPRSNAYTTLLGDVFWSFWVGQGGTRRGMWDQKRIVELRVINWLDEVESDVNEKNARWLGSFYQAGGE